MSQISTAIANLLIAFVTFGGLIALSVMAQRKYERKFDR